MANTFKSVASDWCVGNGWRTLYTCPGGTSAIVKSVIASALAITRAPKLGIDIGGVITPLTGAISVTTAAAVNLAAGTITLAAGDKLVATTGNASAGAMMVLASTFATIGTTNVAVRNASTVLIASDTGIWRSTDAGVSWTQVYTTSMSGAAGCAYIGGAFYFYTSTDYYKSTDDGLTFAATAASNLPSVAVNAFTGLVYNGTVYASLRSGQMTTTTDGMTWTLATAFPNTASTALCWTGTNFVASRNGTTASVYYSTDGAAWSTTTTGLTIYASTKGLASNGSGTVLMTGTAGGTFRSTDHGATWANSSQSAVNNTPVSWTGSVFYINTATNTYAVSATGAANTFATDYSGQDLTTGCVAFTDHIANFATVYRYVSQSLAMPATGGTPLAASLMEVTP